MDQPETSSADVCVVLVTYNSAAVIGRAVASIPAAAEVIVVDNASPEGTAWRGALPHAVTLIEMGRNAGFGTACNAGARAARTRYVLFLNPDAVLAPDALDRLLEAARRYGDPAILMPAMVAENGRLMRKEGTILEPVARRNRLKTFEIAGDYCTRFVHGAAFLMARDAFLALGGFDEAIFLYHEDDDLAVRALAARIPIITVSAARVSHGVGRSSTPSLKQTFAINRFKQQSERYVRRKHGMARPKALSALRLAGGCLMALATLDFHRVAIRAGKLRGLFDPLTGGPPPAR